MKYIKSCGFIVYKKEQNEILYLVTRAHNGDVGFPKGHLEEGESELECALRELREETGIEALPIPGRRYQLEYSLPGRDDTLKQAIYFIGQHSGGEVTPQASEVVWAAFLPYDKAMEILTFDETKRMLADADAFIRSHEI